MEDGVHPGTELAMEYTGAADTAFAATAQQEQVRFSAGYAARTFPFSRQDGFGDLGVQVLVVNAGGQKTAYVLFDGNNMQTGARDEIREAPARPGGRVRGHDDRYPCGQHRLRQKPGGAPGPGR